MDELMGTQWVKQLTRENTLLDRSLRTIAYHQSLREIGKASISKCPVVGKGRVTSWYYDPVDYKKQQQIILSEFQGQKIEKMGKQILALLEEGYGWAKNPGPVSKSNFIDFLHTFNAHHAHARGAICYGYWGEPAVTEKLRQSLAKQILATELDATLSILSVPRPISGPLLELYHPQADVEVKKQALLQSLNLTKEQVEQIEIISWFTLFYEIGERVSSYLYDALLKALKNVVPESEFAELEWYDPVSLERYFAGQKLPQDELIRRKEFYILLLEGDKLCVLSGTEAKHHYEREFAEDAENLAQVREIRGTVASKGQVSGPVKIIVTEADQRKMKDGDILVSPMTTPRLMMAVHKAAAIVTDEGGMTAHAAIVSRELGIPCVVGTKVASQVLKDGDIVDVDANQGKITLIKRA